MSFEISNIIFLLFFSLKVIMTRCVMKSIRPGIRIDSLLYMANILSGVKDTDFYPSMHLPALSKVAAFCNFLLKFPFYYFVISRILIHY